MSFVICGLFVLSSLTTTFSHPPSPPSPPFPCIFKPTSDAAPAAEAKKEEEVKEDTAIPPNLTPA